MPKHVICSLPNASNKINGVAFADHEAKPGHKRTVDPVEDAVADHFASIKGYSIEEVEAKKDGGKKDTKTPPAAAAKDTKTGDAPQGTLV